jgi:hypothetical protein
MTVGIVLSITVPLSTAFVVGAFVIGTQLGSLKTAVKDITRAFYNLACQQPGEACPPLARTRRRKRLSATQEG